MPGRERQRRLLLSGRARDAAPSGGNFGLQGVLRLLVPVTLYGKRRARREHRKNASCHRVRAQNPLPQKAADSAERGGNSVRAGTRRLRRALRAQLTHKKSRCPYFAGIWFFATDSSMLLRVSGLPVQTRVMAPAHRSFAEASRDGSAQAAAFCCFRRWHRCYRQSGRACTKRRPTDMCRRAEPEQRLRKNLDLLSNVFKHRWPPLFFMVSSKNIPLNLQLCNHISPF